MDTTEVVLIVITFAAAGFSLYRKYIKNGKPKSGSGQPDRSELSIPYRSDDDDYEPYSKR